MPDPRPAEAPRGGLRVRLSGWAAARDLRGRDVGVGMAALLALVLILYVALRPASAPAPHGAPAGTPKATAVAAPPAIQPVILMPVDPRTAIAMNATVPFVAGPNPAAPPMALALAEDDRQRAIDCLAAAAAYEAGDDAAGERAVAQVVLNRLRHPAFPRTVCDVVFQGAERATGCQFTFTCDGSIDRRPLPAPVWARAQTIARAALAGAVFAPVGLATHYHADRVVPYWAATLDKLTRVGPHLFYRWRGWWGTPPAFRAGDGGAEPIEPALAALSDVHKPADTLLALRIAAAMASLPTKRDGALVTVTLDRTIAADTLPALARALCAGLDRCVMMGMTGAARPAFAFQHDDAVPSDLALFDCARYPRAAPAECLTEPVLKALRQTAAGLAAPPEAVSIVPPALSSAGTPVEPAMSETTTPAAAPTDAQKSPKAPGFEPIETKRRPRHDPCAAMRSVAAADRVGPCARN